MYQLLLGFPSSKPSSCAIPLAELVQYTCKKNHFVDMLYKYNEPFGKRLVASVNNKEAAYKFSQPLKQCALLNLSHN